MLRGSESALHSLDVCVGRTLYHTYYSLWLGGQISCLISRSFSKMVLRARRIQYDGRTYSRLIGFYFSGEVAACMYRTI
jgi:hypothetical protein